MSDVAKSRGIRIDVPKLSKLLGVPMVSTVASKGVGIQQLLQTTVSTAQDRTAAIANLRTPNYGSEVETHVREIADIAGGVESLRSRPRWYATKLLEDDEKTIERLGAIVHDFCRDDVWCRKPR